MLQLTIPKTAFITFQGITGRPVLKSHPRRQVLIVPIITKLRKIFKWVQSQKALRQPRNTSVQQDINRTYHPLISYSRVITNYKLILIYFLLCFHINDAQCYITLRHAELNMVSFWFQAKLIQIGAQQVYQRRDYCLYRLRFQ